MEKQIPTIVNFVDQEVKAISLDGANPSFEENINGSGISTKQRTEENLLSQLKDTNVGLVRSATKFKESGTLTPDQLLNTQLLYLIRTGVGVDNLDIPALAEQGIIVTNTPKATTESVGEHTLGLALDLLKKQSLSAHKMATGDWKKESTEELRGKSVLVIGSGNIGADAGAKLAMFEAKVKFYDPYAKGAYMDNKTSVGKWGNIRNEESPGAQHIERNPKVFPSLLAEADIITLHVPDQETPLIGEKELEILAAKGRKPYIINTSRPSAVDTAALLKHLEAGNLRGVGLDVYPIEKAALFSSDIGKQIKALLGHKNLATTHHAAGNSKEGQHNTGVEAAEYVEGLKKGLITGFGIKVSEPIPADHVRLSFINENISGALNAVTQALAGASLQITPANMQKTEMFGGADSPVDFNAFDIRNGEATVEELSEMVTKAVQGIAGSPIIKGWISGKK